MHNGAIQAAGLNACYLPIPLFARGLWATSLPACAAWGFLGANVTIPHKQAVIEHVDGLSEESRFTGSVNTVYWDGGPADGNHHRRPGRRAESPSGRHRAGRQEGRDPGNRRRRPGAGFRAGPGQLRGRGGRTGDIPAAGTHPTGPGPGQGRQVGAGHRGGKRARYGGPFRPAGGVRRPRRRGRPHHQLHLGGHDPGHSGCPIDAGLLEPSHIVYDIVYQPRETVLLREAKRQGCRTVEGIGMLVHQGAASLRTWFDRDPDTEVMFAALAAFGYGDGFHHDHFTLRFQPRVGRISAAQSDTGPRCGAGRGLRLTSATGRLHGSSRIARTKPLSLWERVAE